MVTTAVLLALLPAASCAGELDAAWSRPRVGDSVRYLVERRVSDLDDVGKAHEDRLDMSVDAEVAAVQGGTVWVKLSPRRPDGGRFSDPWRGRDLLLPMPAALGPGAEPVPPPFVREEALEAAGRRWDCRVERRSNPRRPEGTFIEYWTADDPGLYLSRGVVRQRASLREGGRTGTVTVTLQAMRRGRSGAKGSVPQGLPSYLEDGMWTNTELTTIKGSQRRLRVRAGAGWIVETKEAGVGRLPPSTEQRTRRLSDLMDELSGSWRRWQEKSRLESEGPAEEPLRFKTGEVRALKRVWAWTGRKDGVRSANTEFHAADPWDKALDGLSYEARFAPMRVLGGRAEKQVELERLSGWGRSEPEEDLFPMQEPGQPEAEGQRR